MYIILKSFKTNDKGYMERVSKTIALADLEGGLRGLQHPFQISKIKESNKTKQKIEENPLEKEEERKSCIFVYFLCVHALIRVSTNIFLSKFSSSPTPPL